MSIGLLRMVVVIHVIFAAMMIILMMIREVITIITDLMKHLKYQLQQQKVALILIMTKLVIGSETIGHSTEQKMRGTPLSLFHPYPSTFRLPFHTPSTFPFPTSSHSPISLQVTPPLLLFTLHLPSPHFPLSP